MTFGLSDFRTFGLSDFRTFGLSDSFLTHSQEAVKGNLLVPRQPLF